MLDMKRYTIMLDEGHYPKYGVVHYDGPGHTFSVAWSSIFLNLKHKKLVNNQQKNMVVLWYNYK